MTRSAADGAGFVRPAKVDPSDPASPYIPLKVAADGSPSIRDLTLTRDSVRQTVRPMVPFSEPKTGPLAADVLVAVPNGMRLRLLRNAGHCDPATPAGTYPLITLKLGALTFYADKLEAGLPWAETVCFEGADGADLTLDLTTVQTVWLNMRYELFAA